MSDEVNEEMSGEGMGEAEEKVNKGNIILAIPNVTFAEGIKKHLKQKDYKVLDVIVALEHLLETLEKLKGEGTKVNAVILTSDVAKKLEDGRLELLADALLEIREKFSHINIVLLANERKGHPFLAEVVQMGIYNVFLKGSEEISIGLLEEVINEPKSFSHASPYLNVSSEHRWRHRKTSIKPHEDDSSTDKQVVNKQVVNKQVNKQVVKRNYQINVENSVEKVVGVPVDKKLILVGSPFSRSGSTFVSHLIARELAKMGVGVTYIESPYSVPYSYDRFIGHEKVPVYRSKFYQYTKEIDAKVPAETNWTLKDVEMIAKHPSDEPIYGDKEVPFDVFVKILLSVQSTVTIVDVGSDWDHEVYRDILDIAAKSYLVLDPDISNIQYLEDPDNEKAKFFQDLLENEKTEVIGNRFDESILKNELIEKLYREKIATIVPSFAPKDVFKSQYEGAFINDTKSYQKQIGESLHPIVKELLPKQFLKKYRKKDNLLGGLFKRKYSVERRDM